MLSPDMSRLFRRIFAVCVLLVGIFVFWGGPSGYATPQECSTCDFNYGNCSSQCNFSDPNYQFCIRDCRSDLGYCSPGCTPSGMPYRPSCPSHSGCAEYYNNCETNCIADRDVCLADCSPNDASCQNLCQDGLNHCRGFCQAEYYDCLGCEN